MVDDFFELYKNSPIETALVQEVRKTPGVVQSSFAFKSEQAAEVPHYTCRIRTQEREFDNVTWLSPWVNHKDGSGMYVIPRRGTLCLICYAKGGKPYIIGWLSPVSEDGNYTGNREVMPDGSMVMRGNAGNKVLVASGGRVRIQSTPTCRRGYSPSFDTIRDFCRNYFLTTAGGTVSFTESRDGGRLTKMVIETFEKADDQSQAVQGPGESVRVQHGTHIDDEGDPEPNVPEGKIFSFIVAKNTVIYIGKNGRIIVRNQHEETGTDPNKITINNDGEFELKNVKDVTIDSEDGEIKLGAGSTKLTMAKDGDITLESDTKVILKAPIVEVDAETKVSLKSQLAELDAIQILLGKAAALNVARFTDVVVTEHDGPKVGTIFGGSFTAFAE